MVLTQLEHLKSIETKLMLGGYMKLPTFGRSVVRVFIAIFYLLYVYHKKNTNFYNRAYISDNDRITTFRALRRHMTKRDEPVE